MSTQSFASSNTGDFYQITANATSGTATSGTATSGTGALNTPTHSYTSGGYSTWYPTTTAQYIPTITTNPSIQSPLYQPIPSYITTPPMWQTVTVPWKMPTIDKNAKNEFTSRCFVIESKTLPEPAKVMGEWAIGVFSFKENRIVPNPLTANNDNFNGYATKEDALIALDNIVQPVWQQLLEEWETI